MKKYTMILCIILAAMLLIAGCTSEDNGPAKTDALTLYSSVSATKPQTTTPDITTTEPEKGQPGTNEGTEPASPEKTEPPVTNEPDVTTEPVTPPDAPETTVPETPSEPHTTHSFGAWRVTKAATCTAEGTRRRDCSGCDEYETESIPATGHSFGEWKVSKAATCTAEGTERRTCTRCNEAETKTIPATGHTFGEWKVSKNATLENEGEETRTCSSCKITEKRSIAKISVNWNKDAAEWMAQLPDTLSLADITIPGTHDSGAQKGLLGMGQCQNLTIAGQLDIGVRFLDIRLKLKSGSLKVYHGIIDMSLTFEQVQNACVEFLKAHPDEIIIMSIKEEDDNNSGFANALIDAINSKIDYWYTENRMPTLGEARGKIVLMSRCNSNGKGISCQNGWSDNTSFTMNNGVSMKIQDYYNVGSSSNIDKKWSDITTLITFAHTSGKGSTFCLNFTSGYTGISGITAVSNVINPKLLEYASGLSSPGCYGTFAIDFVTADLASALIALNFAN